MLLSMLDGRVIGTCMPRHRHQEWIKFLKLIDERMPQDKQLHLIVDNYATHKHPKVLKWLKRHPRFHIHFTPTSASWLNMVERFFRDLTGKRLKRGVFTSVGQLIAAISGTLDNAIKRRTRLAAVRARNQPNMGETRPKFSDCVGCNAARRATGGVEIARIMPSI
jgi:transposase